MAAAFLRGIRDNYVQNFPTEVPIKTAQAFIVAGVISLIAGSAINVALLGGAIAATATLIEAVTRPIIRAVFPETPGIAKFVQVIVPGTIALGLAGSITPWLGVTYEAFRFLLSLMAWIALNDRFYERNVGMVAVL